MYKSTEITSAIADRFLTRGFDSVKLRLDRPLNHLESTYLILTVGLFTGNRVKIRRDANYYKLPQQHVFEFIQNYATKPSQKQFLTPIFRFLTALRTYYCAQNATTIASKTQFITVNEHFKNIINATVGEITHL